MLPEHLQGVSRGSSIGDSSSVRQILQIGASEILLSRHFLYLFILAL